MASFSFNLKPRSVKKINTKNRVIKTKIPVPQSIKIINELKTFETENAREQLPVIWDKAKESFIYDPYGNKWIDFTSSIFVTNSGHGNSNIIVNLKKILKKPLLHTYYYPTLIRRDFLKKLIQITPKNLNKAILLSAGTEATERALKICTIYGKENNKKFIIAWEGNYHGKTLNAQLLSGQFEDQKWIQKKNKNIIHLPFPYPWTNDNKKISGKELFYNHLKIIKRKIKKLELISGFFVESFQGWGAIFYPKDYITELRKWSYNNQSLLIFDEIQAGFYRTGKIFAYQHYGVRADMVICGKGISGSLPLSAVLGEKKYINLDSNYTSTHGGNPVACAAGLGNLESLSKINMNILKKKEELFFRILNSWKNKFPNVVRYVFGKGMIYGVLIFKKNTNTLDIDLVNKVCEKAMEKGVFSICTGRGSLKLGPPITISESALIEGLKVYEDCLGEMIS
tara:strand:+ start:894 stop:2255 length:1362 start_codon:yes stop_codon:yes gene_type:complete